MYDGRIIVIQSEFESVYTYIQAPIQSVGDFYTFCTLENYD